MFFPCIINFHKTGTVHLGRKPFSSTIMFLFWAQWAMWRAILLFWLFVLEDKQRPRVGFKRIEFEKLEKSVVFLPSEVFLVKCQYLVLLYYNQSLETTRFHIQPVKDNYNWWFKSSPIHQNYWKYSKHKILAAYLGVLRLLVRGLQKIINIEFIRHFRLSWIQLSFFWNTMRIITSVQNHLNLSAFYT